MAIISEIQRAPALPPPVTETGVIGWARANLFSAWYNGALTILAGGAALLALWFGLEWAILEADWNVVASVGGRFAIGNFNSDQACPGNNCFWRPQVSLLLVTTLLGVVWGAGGGGLARWTAILVAGVAALFAFLPYGLDRMGVDVRLLLLANLAAVAAGWLLGRYTPLGRLRWTVFLGVIFFALTLVLLRGMSEVPGLQPVSVIYWGGLTVNLLLAGCGIALSLPLGIGLALGRRSNLPVVKLLCILFIEVFRGVPLITLLFMSQVLVPLAFPEAFPQNSLFRAGAVITLFSAAYMAENIRGGLQALHAGQAEAARALGLPGWQTTLLISLPQAIRNVIPAIAGQFIGLFKDTSLVYIIGMLDIVEIGRTIIVGRPEYQGAAQEMFVFLALVFWLFTYGMSYISRRVEEQLGVGQR